MQGLRRLAQVALAYLDVSEKFCFPGITSSTVSPGLVPKYPGRAPKGALFVWRPWGGWDGVRVSRVCRSRGGFRLLAHTRTCTVAFFIWTHSQRETWGDVIPCPTGLLTVRVVVNGGSALPRVSTPLLVLCLSSPGIARLLSHQLVSAEPRSMTATRPLGHSPVFIHLDVRGVYLVDSFIARDRQYNAHMTSPILTLSGHTFSG